VSASLGVSKEPPADTVSSLQQQNKKAKVNESINKNTQSDRGKLEN
jgi:hypothetical protein